MASGLKVVFIIVNVLLLLLGALCVALGVWCFLSDVDIINLANIDADGTYGTNFRSPGLLEIMAWISIVAGAVTFALAILALVGVGKGSKWMLALYAALLGVVLLLSLVSIALGALLKTRIEDDLENALFDGIMTMYDGNINSQNVFSYSFDNAQVQLECCGVRTYTDFIQNATLWRDVDSLQIPKACCKVDEYQYVYERLYVWEVDVKCSSAPNSTNSNFDNTCVDEIEDSLMTKTLVLMAISCVVVLVELLGIFLGCCLMRTTKDNPNMDYRAHGY